MLIPIPSTCVIAALNAAPGAGAGAAAAPSAGACWKAETEPWQCPGQEDMGPMGPWVGQISGFSNGITIGRIGIIYEYD